MASASVSCESYTSNLIYNGWCVADLTIRSYFPILTTYSSSFTHVARERTFTMPTDVLSFQGLSQRIQHQEAELAKLRGEFETRKKQLADLARRKEELQAQLHEVESEIQAVHVSTQTPKAALPPSTPKKPAAAKPAAKKRKGVSLAQFLTDCVREARKPITTKELAEEVVRTKYPTKSSNIRAMVDTRVGELVTKGIFRRADNQPGVVLAGSTASKQPAAKTPSSNGRMKVSVSAPHVRSDKKLSLKAVLLNVLTESSRPQTTEELVEKVLATGYQTKSGDFKNVIWVTIGNMPNVKRIQGKGYQLKKGKS